jgi:hypothetical protein
VLFWLLIPVLFLLLLTTVGFVSIVLEARAHSRKLQAVDEYRNIFIAFANSDFNDTALIGQLQLKSTAVEEALGADNFISGATAFHMFLSGIPAVPFLIREIVLKSQEWLWEKDSRNAAVLVDNVLIRHIGRRQSRLEDIRREACNPFHLIYRGWKSVVSLPLYLLAAFGLIGQRSIQSAQNSIIFKLINFATFVATLAATLFAYLADKSAIDKALNIF